MVTYNLELFENDINSLSTEIMNKINKLNETINNSNDDTRYEKHKNRKNRKNIDVKPVLFNKIKPTVSDIDLIINNIRMTLNKISLMNYDIQKELIFEFIDEYLNTNDSDIIIIVELYINITCINKNLLNVYITLWKDMIQKYDKNNIFNSILVNKYKTCSDDIEYIDSSVNYNQYCLNNKNNDKRKNLNLFVLELIKLQHIDIGYNIALINKLKNIMMNDIMNTDKFEITDEIIHLLSINIITNLDNIKQNIEWEKIKNFIVELKDKPKTERIGISSRSYFKILDIYDLL
tara:strand:+ start:1485 stop:2357 length:873 start_codon:yes stop_codon:yes gene_type:complete